LTEIAVTPPPARTRLRALQIAAIAIGSALVAAGLMALRPVRTTVLTTTRIQTARVHVQPHRHTAPPARVPRPTPPRVAAAPRISWSAASEAALARAASVGLDRGLFTRSPSGALATAARVARWRPLIVRSARGSGFSPNVLEGIVFLESAGRADAIAGSDPAAASGLTQIVASTGAGFLHMRVHLGASRILTWRIQRAERHGRWHRVRVLEARRRRVDQRFAPAAALRGTVRYLKVARGYLGRNDLAVASYHMGIGNLQGVIRRWGGGTPSYARLYFSSAPDRHAAAWRRLNALDDGTRDYYWKVLAAERLMRLYRHDRGALAFEERQQARKNSAEEVLHPASVTPRFWSPRDLVAAWRHHRLRRIPRGNHLKLAPSFAQMASRLGRSGRLYRGLRPAALDVLLYIGNRVHEISGSRRPLQVTSAVRDVRYQGVLIRYNGNAARTYSLHTTGYAFDIARSYGSRRQAAAFQFVLERLQALNLIAYIKESEAIHIAVSSRAVHAAALLRRAG
jgi:Family of unknown function (DUF5715)